VIPQGETTGENGHILGTYKEGGGFRVGVSTYA
jgi:hypothetical protein